METTLLSLAHGFSVAFEPTNLWYAFLGCLVGTLVGVLPGIGPLAGISILLPVTFGLNATQAIIMLAGIYYGSQYGGSTTSILMRIPGEASSVMTCIDGYAMAKKGRAGAALCIAAVGSWIGGIARPLEAGVLYMADWKDTLNLPRTGFPMKANLQTTEPQTHRALGRDRPVRADPRAPRRARRSSSSTTARRTPTAASTSARAQQGPEGLRRPVADAWPGSTRRTCPGWDCHGLPIELKVDRELGPKKRADVDRRLPPRLPRRTPTASSTSSARTSSGSA